MTHRTMSECSYHRATSRYRPQVNGCMLYNVFLKLTLEQLLVMLQNHCQTDRWMVSCLIPTTKLHGNNCKHKSGPYPDQNGGGGKYFYINICNYFLQQKQYFFYLRISGGATPAPPPPPPPEGMALQIMQGRRNRWVGEVTCPPFVIPKLPKSFLRAYNNNNNNIYY